MLLLRRRLLTDNTGTRAIDNASPVDIANPSQDSETENKDMSDNKI